MSLLNVGVQNCTSARQLLLMFKRKNPLRMQELLMPLCRLAFGGGCIKQALHGMAFAPVDPSYQKQFRQVRRSSIRARHLRRQTHEPGACTALRLHSEPIAFSSSRAPARC